MEAKCTDTHEMMKKTSTTTRSLDESSGSLHWTWKWLLPLPENIYLETSIFFF